MQRDYSSSHGTNIGRYESPQSGYSSSQTNNAYESSIGGGYHSSQPNAYPNQSYHSSHPYGQPKTQDVTNSTGYYSPGLYQSPAYHYHTRRQCNEPEPILNCCTIL